MSRTDIFTLFLFAILTTLFIASVYFETSERLKVDEALAQAGDVVEDSTRNPYYVIKVQFTVPMKIMLFGIAFLVFLGAVVYSIPPEWCSRCSVSMDDISSMKVRKELLDV